MRIFNFKRKNKDVIAAYSRLFNTVDGKIVLQDLMQDTSVMKSVFDKDPIKMSFNEGGRNVVLRIMKFMSIKESALEELMKEQEERDAQYFEEEEYA